MNEQDFNDELIETAGKLSKSVSPERDLWPGIAEGIAEGIARPRRSRWTPMLAQAAAVILLVGASSGLTFLAMKDDQQAAAVIVPQLTIERASFGGSFALGPDYFEVRGDMAAQLDEELARLSPETRAEVEENLALIRGAIAEIDAALADEPGNVLLQKLLLRAYQDELALMYRVGGLTQHVMSRKDI